MIARPRHLAGVASLSLAIALPAGCASSRDPGTAPASARVPTHDASCPLLVPETTLVVEDTQAGPSFVFLTTGDVAEVRTRGRALAAMHNQRKGPPGAMGTRVTAVSSAVAADIEGGVRVTYRPADPNDLGKLGDELRRHASHLAGASSCAI